MLHTDPTADIHVLRAENTGAAIMCLSGIIGFLMMLTVDAMVGNSSDVWYCTETRECLHFDLMCETEDYEVRHYDSVQWVSTDEENYFMEPASVKAFHRLYKYITGHNEKGLQIEMTTPVLTKVTTTYFWEPNRYTLSFVLPSEYQINAPMPTDPSVYLHRTKQMYVYVKSYGGWTTTFLDVLKHYYLSCALNDHHANFTKDYHYAASYNKPTTIMNRHNEVWVELKGNPVCGPYGVI